MPYDFAYNQLLTLIGARSQQWLRNQIDLMPRDAISDAQIDDVAEIAVAAHICTGLRGTEAPLQAFIRSRSTPEFTDLFMARFQSGKAIRAYLGTAVLRCLSPDRLDWVEASDALDVADRLALTDMPDAALLAAAEAVLRRPIPEERLDDQTVESYASLLALCYRFGAERPRFSDPRAYGDAFANCLRFADWAERNGRLVPLVQMIFCLCLIDPDHDVMPLLADVIASQRPDGSFPARIGFGTADQDGTALRSTLATVVALHMVIHRRWRTPQPSVPMAA